MLVISPEKAPSEPSRSVYPGCAERRDLVWPHALGNPGTQPIGYSGHLTFLIVEQRDRRLEVIEHRDRVTAGDKLSCRPVADNALLYDGEQKIGTEPCTWLDIGRDALIEMAQRDF